MREFDIIIESYANGQKKQAVEQFKNLSEDDQITFLVDNIIEGGNDLLLCRLMGVLVRGFNEAETIKYKINLGKS